MSAQILDLLAARDLLGVRPAKARTGKPKPIRRQPEKPKPRTLEKLPADNDTRFERFDRSERNQLDLAFTLGMLSPPPLLHAFFTAQAY